MVVPPPGPLDKQDRQVERMRIVRLSRLPPLQEFSLRGARYLDAKGGRR